MRQAASLVLVVVVIVGLMAFSARRDYDWAPGQIAQRTAEGWTLAHQSDNFIDPTRLWTIFRTPVTGLWFVRLDEAAEVSGKGYFVVPSASLHFDYEKTDRIDGMYVFDLAQQRSAFVADAKLKSGQIDIDGLKWRTYEPGTPGDALVRFVGRALRRSPR